MKLSELPPLAGGSVTIRGRQLAVTAPSQRTVARIAVWQVPPVPPLGPDPAAGSLSAWIPNINDAGYIAKRRAWKNIVNCIEAALGLGLEVDGLKFDPAADDKENSLWAYKAAQQVAEMLTPHELEAVLEAMAATAAAIDKDAEKK